MAGSEHPLRRRALAVALLFSALGVAMVAGLGGERQAGPPEPPRAAVTGSSDSSPRVGRPHRREPGEREPATADDAGVVRRLSNETTRSRWAYLRRPTVARSAPSAEAPAVGRVDLETSVDTPELVLALAERRNEGEGRWVEVRLPIRPNGRTGWVPRRDLERYYLVRTALRIDRRRRVATLYERGEEVWRAPIGIGEERWPTPAGRFYVRTRIVPVDAGGSFRRDGAYGVFAFGTSGHAEGLSDWPGGGVIGIHGTNRPAQVPGRVSHGCIRLKNRDIARLRELMPLGTPIEIV